jgi:hypothetical protein
MDNMKKFDELTAFELGMIAVEERPEAIAEFIASNPRTLKALAAIKYVSENNPKGEEEGWLDDWEVFLANIMFDE